MSIEDEQVRQEILESFGLNEGECEIRFEDSFYIVQPKNKRGQLHIAPITSADVFNQHNLEFRSCVFKCEVSLEQQKISAALSFQSCIFKKDVSIKKSEFLESISFINSIFKENLYVTDTDFHSPADFSSATFEGMAHFSASKLQNVSLPNSDKIVFCL